MFSKKLWACTWPHTDGRESGVWKCRGFLRLQGLTSILKCHPFYLHFLPKSFTPSLSPSVPNFNTSLWLVLTKLSWLPDLISFMPAPHFLISRDREKSTFMCTPETCSMHDRCFYHKGLEGQTCDHLYLRQKYRISLC